MSPNLTSQTVVFILKLMYSALPKAYKPLSSSQLIIALTVISLLSLFYNNIKAGTIQTFRRALLVLNKPPVFPVVLSDLKDKLILDLCNFQIKLQ